MATSRVRLPFQPGRRAFLAVLPGLAAVSVGCARRGPDLDREFRIGLPYEVESLDPHASTTTGSFTVLGNVFEPLVFTYASQGLKPALAHRWSSPDSMTWIFELRPGVRFHSGRPLTAYDVVFSLERARQRADLDARYYLGDVVAVEALDAARVRLRAKRKAPVLLYKLAHVAILSADTGPGSPANGTGPYRVTDWLPGRLLRLERNEAHWDEQPAIRRAAFALRSKPADLEAGMAGGEYEMTLLGPSRKAQAPGARYRLQQRSSLMVKYLGFDLGRDVTPFCSRVPNPFLDARVREAIDLALDRPGLVARLPSLATPANQLVTRDVFGFVADLPPLTHQPERARALLAEAGLTGLQATLHTRHILQDGALIVRDQLRAVGIELRVEALPDSDYFERLDRRELSVWLDRWSCTTGDAAELFETALHTNDPAKGLGAFNESRYGSPTLDRLIEQALDQDAIPERRTALEAAMRQAMRERPWIPLYTEGEVWAIDRNYRWEPRVDFWLHLADVTLADGA